MYGCIKWAVALNLSDKFLHQ